MANVTKKYPPKRPINANGVCYTDQLCDIKSDCSKCDNLNPYGTLEDLKSEEKKAIGSWNLEKRTLAPDDFLTGERIYTPRGSFSEVSLSKKEIESMGYGYYFTISDSNHIIIGNGKRCFAVKNI